MSTSHTHNSGEQPSPTRVCDGCFAEFNWLPTEFEGQSYCCRGCADGGPCACTYGEPPIGAIPESEGALAGQDDQAEDPSPREPDQSRPVQADVAPISSSSATPPPSEPPRPPPPPTPPTGSSPVGDDGDEHECYNCFAQFSWDPTTVDGESFTTAEEPSAAIMWLLSTRTLKPICCEIRLS